jgi:hypothetical protein
MVGTDTLDRVLTPAQRQLVYVDNSRALLKAKQLPGTHLTSAG